MLSGAQSPGCAHVGSRNDATEGATVSHHFDLWSRFETRMFEPDGNELPSPWAEPFQRHWAGTLERAPARSFRDGSLGDRVTFEGVARNGEPIDLGGISIELRSFGNGEILALDALEHAVGTGRDADLMIPLWPALSPRLPEIEPGETTRQRSNLPFLLEDGQGMIVGLDLEWSLEEPQPCPDHGSCWHFGYRGPATGRGLDRGPDYTAHYRLTGQASGDVWVRTEDIAIARSTFTWEFDVKATTSLADGSSPTTVVLQHQHHRGYLAPEGSSP